MTRRAAVILFSLVACALALNAAIDNIKAIELLKKGDEAFKVYRDPDQALAYYGQAIELASGYVRASALLRTAYMSHLLGNPIPDYLEFIKEALTIDPAMKLEPIDYQASFIEVFNDIKNKGKAEAKPAAAKTIPKTEPAQQQPVTEPAVAEPKAAAVEEEEPAAAEPDAEAAPEEEQPQESEESELAGQRPSGRRLGLKAAAGLAIPFGSRLPIDEGRGEYRINYIMGPALHLSLVNRFSDRIEAGAGVEFLKYLGGTQKKDSSDEYGENYKIVTYSGLSTICFFASGRYHLARAKIFFEGGLGYTASGRTLTVRSYVNQSYDEGDVRVDETTSTRETIKRWGLRIGGGYRIDESFEAEFCANFAGRTTVFMMIGYRK